MFVDPMVRDDEGATPLHYCARKKQQDDAKVSMTSSFVHGHPACSKIDDWYFSQSCLVFAPLSCFMFAPLSCLLFAPLSRFVFAPPSRLVL